MMSYFAQSQNPNVTASIELLQTPMAVDWLALDDIYGRFGYGIENAFTDDTTWGFNTTISANVSRIWADWENWADRTASTIIDSGGTDTIDVSGYSQDQTLDLTVQTADMTAQYASDIGGRVGNLALAVGTVIESAVGGAGDDSFIGTGADSTFWGNGGDDLFWGGGGDDVFHGGAGLDTVRYASAFADYAFTLLSGAIEVAGEAVSDGIDLIFETIETLAFADATYAYADILNLFGNFDPEAADDRISVLEGDVTTVFALENDTDEDRDPLEVTAIDGTEVSLGDSLVLASGASVWLAADGALDYAQNGAFASLEDGQTTQDTFSYAISDGQGGTDDASVTVTITGVSEAGPGGPGVPPEGDVIGQSGIAQISRADASDWVSITFDTALDAPVIALGPLTTAEGDAVATSIRNVSATGFEVQLADWPEEAGGAAALAVNWIAVETGIHWLEGGQKLVAAETALPSGASDVSFGTLLSDALVFSEVASDGAGSLRGRVVDVGEDGFSISPDGSATLSWIAVEEGGGESLDALRVPETALSAQFAPVVLADRQADAVAIGPADHAESADGAAVEDTFGVLALSGGLLYGVKSNATPTAKDDRATVSQGSPLVFDVRSNDTDAEGGDLSVSMIDRRAIDVGGQVTLASGATVAVNADGHLRYHQNDAFAGLEAGARATDPFT